MGGRALLWWKLLQLFLPRKRVNTNQCLIPAGISKISASIKNLNDAGVMIPSTSSFGFPIWSMGKTDVAWRMTVDHDKINQGVAPIAAAIPDVVLLL